MNSRVRASQLLDNGHPLFFCLEHTALQQLAGPYHGALKVSFLTPTSKQLAQLLSEIHSRALLRTPGSVGAHKKRPQDAQRQD